MRASEITEILDRPISRELWRGLANHWAPVDASAT